MASVGRSVIRKRTDRYSISEGAGRLLLLPLLFMLLISLTAFLC